MEAPLHGEEMFVKFDSITGESKDVDHTGWSDAYAFGYGASNEHSTRSTSTGVPILNEFVVSKPIDRSSPLLFEAMLKGTVISQVTFDVRGPSLDGSMQVFLRYTFEDVTISSLTTGTTAETLTLQYSTVTEDYIPQTASGAPGSPISRTLDRTVLGASIATTPGTEREVQRGGSQMFIRADGIDGTSQFVGHEDWMDGLGFGLCIRAPSSGAPAFGDITVVKGVDSASPPLLAHTATGQVIPTVDIEFYQHLSDGSFVSFLTYQLEDVSVTSVGTQTNMETGGSIESVSLSFTRIAQTYTEYDDTGSSAGDTSSSWDLDTGTA